jgi:hypothetical protein
MKSVSRKGARVMGETATLGRDGHDRLWGWFGLSRAAFLTLPRVLMHQMPDDWQRQMAALLEEYNATFTNLPDIGATVRATRDGKLVPMPDVYTNYRHPRREEIEVLK